MPAAAQPIIMMVLMFAVFYFILIRPQVKKQREHQEMLNKLQNGDMVVTRGGLIGKVTGATDKVLTIELQEKVRVRVLRTHVDGKYQPSTAAASANAEAA